MYEDKNQKESIMENNILEAKIVDMTSEGKGVAKVDGIAYFIPNAVIGDEVSFRVEEMKKNFGIGKVLSYKTKSDIRQDAKCKHFDKCGGCQIQNIKYENQLEIKKNMVKERIARIAKQEDFKLNDIIADENTWNYRNKNIYQLIQTRDDIKIGFYEKGSNKVIEIKECHIHKNVNMEILEIVKGYLLKNKIPVYNNKNNRGIVRNIYIRQSESTKEIMVCLVVNENRLVNENELINSLQAIEGVKTIAVNINRGRSKHILGKETIILDGSKYITEKIGKFEYKLSPLSFFQINNKQAEKMYGEVIRMADIQEDETVMDLYCGTGSITMFLAEKAKKVIGIEMVRDAVKDAKENAKLNNISNVQFVVGKAEEILTEDYKIDTLVVDPPRAGLDKKLVNTILDIEPSKIVYVSCDSATLSRDINLLADKYKLEEVTTVDMFPHTMHVETVVKLVRD